MTRNDIYQKLNGIFQDIFDDDSIMVNDDTTADDIDDWDSLSHISLIAAIEDEFSIKFDMKTVFRMKNVGEMVSIISEMIS